MGKKKVRVNKAFWKTVKLLLEDANLTFSKVILMKIDEIIKKKKNVEKFHNAFTNLVANLKVPSTTFENVPFRN